MKEWQAMRSRAEDGHASPSQGIRCGRYVGLFKRVHHLMTLRSMHLLYIDARFLQRELIAVVVVGGLLPKGPADVRDHLH